MQQFEQHEHDHRHLLGKTLLISTSLALLSYGRAVATSITDDSHTFPSPLNILSLYIATLLIPAFIYWMHRQTRFSRPALISNTLWTNLPITSICITVFLLWGTLNPGEQLTALCLQNVRDVSALTSSLHFLPAPICGLLMTIAIGALLPHLPLCRRSRRLSRQRNRAPTPRNAMPHRRTRLQGWRLPGDGAEPAGGGSHVHDRQPSDDGGVSGQDAGPRRWGAQHPGAGGEERGDRDVSSAREASPWAGWCGARGIHAGISRRVVV
ncbi:uncharacterized protein BO66DRAFT_101036 [Aspergillus aculeatinus CBS 121060]|uniref:Uncharacterized protein n=1 Tax=Aspergillus aculeatinus CBS 121060 TaxID=1448322 RepID=A0ACD1H744_9EURO|nr:hypothetical protein BO66DRAFT_101036 [Aspergillus aculeatinus CBS 121060]RAH69405.1 hypothetical protein BO66DRAFT_101036 [Aspergillus aculeatinus CBS 121060]